MQDIKNQSSVIEPQEITIDSNHTTVRYNIKRTPDGHSYEDPENEGVIIKSDMWTFDMRRYTNEEYMLLQLANSVVDLQAQLLMGGVE